MAEGTSASSQDLVSLSIIFSSSEDDETSQQSHDSTRRKGNGRVLCRYFQQGRCRFGDECWYIHSQPTKEINTKASVHHDRNLAGPSRQCSENREINSSRVEHGKKNTYDSKIFLCDFGDKRPASNPPNWVHAPEFFPKVRSYADILKRNTEFVNLEREKISVIELCSYYETGECPFKEQCPYIHGDLCEICQKNVLFPHDETQRQNHTEQCIKELEQDMELSFAVQRSQDKSCGICMDVVLEKEPKAERRFGILEKCNHVFCLSCIRKWRKVKNFDSNHLENVLDPVVTRACPECRVTSDFITPSQYWVDNEEEKKKLISDYKIALSMKPCKYFKQGKGNCPFGGACFYLHAKPDGTKVELPPPVRRRRQNQDGELDFMDRIYLWDYLELREENFLMHLELDDLMYAISDTDTDASDTSDNFILSETF